MLTVFCFTSMLVGCNESEPANHKPGFKMALTYEVVPEDLDQNYYAISWTDTLGKAIGMHEEHWHARPVEIWCEIFSADRDSTLLADYHGMSTPQRFLYFQTQDSVVNVRFSIGPNVFSPHLSESVIKSMDLPIRFQPIQVSLKRERTQPVTLELQSL